MGGGHRTKASAAAAAAAMGASGFVGFDAFATADTAQSSTVAEGPSPFYEGNHEAARTAFKALGKRDALTKLKALQELRAIAHDEGTARAELRPVLRHFLYQFTRILTREPSPHVREAACLVLAALAQRVPKLVRKSAASFLGELLCAAADPGSTEVSRAARAALEQVQQVQQQEGASLLEEHAASVGAVLRERLAAKGDEEMQAVLKGGALGALGLLASWPGAFAAAAGVVMKPTPSATWKAAFSDASPSVRGAGLALLGKVAGEGLFKVGAAVTVDEGTVALLCKMIGNEDNAQVLQRLMDALLTLLVALRDREDGPGFFDLVGDYRKAFFPQLWKLLGAGARGAGNSVYPTMLPLVSLVPENVWEAYGAEVLATKWLEALRSGADDQEALGAHNMPALLRAELECMAFMVRNGKPFPDAMLVDIVRLFFRETQRFKLGQDLPAIFKLPLAGLREDAPAWDALHALCRETFFSAPAPAVRVAQLLRAAGKLPRARAIAQELLEQSLGDTEEACLSMEALSLLVFEGTAVPTAGEALIARIRAARDSTEAGAAFGLLIRVVVLAASEPAEQARIWDGATQGMDWESLPASQTSAIARALEAVAAEEAGAARVDRVTECLMQAPSRATTEALHKLGWLTPDEVKAAREQAVGMLQETVGAALAGGAGALDAHRVAESAAVARLLAADDDAAVQGVATVADELLGLEAGAPPGSGTMSPAARAWLEAWLRDAIAKRPEVDWTVAARPSELWARVALRAELVETVFGGLDHAALGRRGVMVAMHVSEDMPDGACLGFDEPPELLCHLLHASDFVADWREAVLVPYVTMDAERCLRTVACAVARGQLGPQEACLVDAVAQDGELFDSCLESTFLPALTAPVGDPALLQVLVERASEQLDAAGVLEKLGALFCERVLAAVPESRRQSAQDIAERFVSAARSAEAGDKEDDEAGAEAGAGEGSGDDEQEEEEARQATAVAPTVRTPVFKEDEEILYIKEGGRDAGVVKGVHTDDPAEPYYTVKLSGGREVQTTEAHLRPKNVTPTTLTELNDLLAAARRAGDHKESLRLMKLQPTLVPKPVDSDQARKQALDAARKRRERALERLAASKRAEGDAEPRRGAAAAAEEDGNAPPSPSSGGGSRAAAAAQLDCLAMLLLPGRAARPDFEEMGHLLAAAACLPALAPPQAVALLFRQQFNAKDPLVALLGGALGVLDALAAHLQFDLLPDEIKAYLERIVLTCLTQGASAPELCARAFAVSARLPKDDPMMDRVYDAALAEARSRVLHASASATAPPPALGVLLARVPAAHVLEDERERSEAERLPQLLVACSDNDPHAINLLRLFGRCCKESNALVKLWWPANELLFDAVGSSNTSTDAKKDQEEEEEWRRPAFSLIAWCGALYLVRRMRVLDPTVREGAAERIQAMGVAEEALRWSLLGETSEKDELGPLVALLTLRALPALSRRWFTDSNEVNRSGFARVKRRMASKVGPQIVEEEMEDVENAEKLHMFEAGAYGDQDQETTGDGAEELECGTIKVTASRKARTVTALYTKEDCEVEIQITLPATFPLQNVDVQCTRQVGIKRERWRRMVLQITTMLSTQDGTLLDAITFWKFNMDKEFQGMEPCPICYAVVHANDGSLPKLRCTTCKNAFHAKCLVKWFKTSHQNNCPLCKQAF